MCPNCRAFITTDDKVCPYCDMKLGPRAIDVRDPGALVGGLIPHARFLTVLILLFNGGLYAATMLYSMNAGNPSALTDIDTRTLVLFGGKFGPVFGSQWWRLITAGFLHGGIIHILMNSWVMLDLGAAVEETYGAARMGVIYIASTVAGFALSAWWSPSVPSIGASAGIFGLIGAMIAYGTLQRSAVGNMIRSHYMRWAVYGLAIGLLGFRIDNGAHIGGLAGGFAIAMIAGSLPSNETMDWIWNVLAALTGVLTAYAFLQMYLTFQEYSR